MFKSIGRSIGGFFRDIVAPIGLSFLGPAGPFIAAAYSGINTGIKTGSPLAGLGSAGLSLGLSSAFKGLTASEAAPKSMGTIIQEGAGPTAYSGIGSGVGDAALNITNPMFQTASPTSALFSKSIEGGAAAIPNTAFTAAPTASTGIMDRLSNVGNLFDADKLKANFIDTTIKEQVPGGITDALPDFITRQSPLTVAGAGLALKTAATPPPEPAPFGPIQPQRTTDFSKYGYKGPLNRGEYTYADPEDIAYGRVTPGSYGYLGAKEGGPIKLSGGGVGSGMMQYGPYNPAIEKQKGTFRPTGSMVAPELGPTISKIAQTQPMMSVSKEKIAGLAQPVAPTIPTTNIPMAQPQTPTPMPMPQPQQQGGVEEQARQLINDLPQKDISVNIDSIRQFLGLAEGGKVPTTEKEFARLGVYKRPEDYDTKKMNVGGEVPGMAKQAPAGITGPSSNIDAGVYASRPEKMSEEEFVQGFLSIMPNNILGNTVRELGLGENVGKQMYQQYKNYTQPKKEMAEGGEVESNQTLQSNAFVIPADVVGHIGDGSSDAGAQRLQSYLGMNPQQYQAGGIMAGELQGPGGGMDDLIQTSIEGKRAAAVSPEEFVVPRDIVAELGQGSYDKGSNKLYALMRNVRQTKTGTTKQPAELTRGLGQLMRTAVA